MKEKSTQENMREILRVKGICRADILKDVSFVVNAGEMIAIMGPSGSGKSTLLYNVSGMDQADAGEVWLGETEIVGLPEDEKAALRLNSMGFVFQQMNVLSNLNIIDNIMLPAFYAAGKKRGDKAAIRERALKRMEEFHIRELADRSVAEVSGGELQRACICRSMMLQPEILFADEPTGALNQSAAEEATKAFLKLNADGTTILMVTHDSRVASKCDRVLYILDGELKGEIDLGKYEPGHDKKRETSISEWLGSLGW